MGRTRPLGILLAFLALPAAVALPAHAQGSCNYWPVGIRPEPGSTEFTAGCTEYVLKYGGGSGTQSSYGPLDLTILACDDPPASGADAFRTYLGLGFHCPIEVWATCLGAVSGNMAGAMQSAISNRFQQDTDAREGICFADYHGNGSRLVAVLVVTTSMPGCQNVVGFARLFLTRIPGSGNADLLYVNYLGSLPACQPETPARASTWGGVKSCYR